jgi:hypothetical protein
MPDFSAGDGEYVYEIDQIIQQFGATAISHMVQLIEDAVRRGDDNLVDRLDRLMRGVEERLANPKRR